MNIMKSTTTRERSAPTLQIQSGAVSMYSMRGISGRGRERELCMIHREMHDGVCPKCRFPRALGRVANG